MQDLILLGAGASADAGIPLAYDMTRVILTHFEQEVREEKCNRILQFVVGGLLFQQGTKGKNPFIGINVEELFSAIQNLSNRQHLEVTPFISSWHPLIEELDKLPSARKKFSNHLKLRDLLVNFADALIKSIGNKLSDVSVKTPDEQEIDKQLRVLLNNPKSTIKFGALIAKAIENTFKSFRNLKINNDKSSYDTSRKLIDSIESILNYSMEESADGMIFKATCDLMLQELIKLVWLQDNNKISYLEDLLRKSYQDKITIASLNYDNSVELTAQKLNLPLTTGIDDWASFGQFVINNDKILLLKLHGSINWSLIEGEYSSDRPLPYNMIKQIPSEELDKICRNRTPGQEFQPAIIFGQGNKLTVEGPFSELLRTFSSQLQLADRLTVIGYSFRDEHINELIIQWFNKNSQRKIRIINGTRFNHNQIPFLKYRFTNLESRIEIINKQAKEGIKLCYGFEN